MREVLTILTELGQEFGISAELTGLMPDIRPYERLTGERSHMGTIRTWMETAVTDLADLATVFHPTSQTAAHVREEAVRLRSYVDRLRGLGFLSTNPLVIHEPPAGVGRD